MSYARIRNILVVPNVPRNFHLEHEAAADFAIDLFTEYQVVGLDWAIFNRDAAASITIAIDSGVPITIPAGGSRGFNNIKYGLLKIVAAVNYTLVIAGVLI